MQFGLPSSPSHTFALVEVCKFMPSRRSHRNRNAKISNLIHVVPKTHFGKWPPGCLRCSNLGRMQTTCSPTRFATNDQGSKCMLPMELPMLVRAFLLKYMFNSIVEILVQGVTERLDGGAWIQNNPLEMHPCESCRASKLHVIWRAVRLCSKPLA